MALADLYKISKDNLTPVKYSEKSIQTKDHSKLNIDKIPSKYSKKSIHSEVESNLDIKSTPTKYWPK